ncbi:MAG: hypothetical protein R6U61_08720 [Thermoplasmata archaeon]
MEKTIKVDKPISLFGIKSVKSAGILEKNLVELLDSLPEGIETDPKAHEKLLLLGKKISQKANFKGSPVDEFLKDRKSVR